MGRELLSETAWRKAKEIQRLREDEREMREETRQDDSRKESGNRQDETSTKKGLTKKSALIIDIKKNHAIVAWFRRGLPMSVEIKTPIVYNESMTRQSKIKYTIGGY